jgi:hypothetical protein
VATLRFELLRREAEGAFPCVVRTPEGRVLRLHGDAAPRHARWLGMVDGTTVWSEPADLTGIGTDEWIEVNVVELIDEVGVPLGPDAGDHGGLFDPPSEFSLTGERTGGHTDEAGGDAQRTALLAWIAVTLGEGGPPAALGPAPAALRGRIADEPPDLLPSLGAPPSPRSTGRVLRPPPAAPRPLVPDLDDTATQVDALAPAGPSTEHTEGWLPAEKLVRIAPFVAGGLLVLSALAWWIWAVPRLG